MKLTELFLAQLEAEGRRTRRVIENVPDGRDDWQPHPRSMALGRLTILVAGMPSWFALIVNGDQLDVKPAGGPAYNPPPMHTKADRLKALDDALAQARKALEGTTDARLMEPWRLLEAGKVMSEDPRYVVLRDTFMHLAHHRAQLTVYLRLNDVPVPAIYGPSADDHRYD